MQPVAPLARIFLLGEPRLEYETETLPLPGRESLLRLLVRLALQPGQILSRRNLAFSLWPDSPEPEALANLRRHLYLLRSLLPPALQDILVVEAQTVSWQTSPCLWLDVNAFEQAGQSLEDQERAAELYRGELAQGIEGDDFLIARREALRQRFLSILKNLAQGYAQRGDLTRALDWTRRLTLHDPWDEETIRLKMTLETQSGNRAAALATYQNLARELERELHAQPMPETMALYSDILHNRLARPSPSPKSAAPLFLRRETELEQLSRLFRRLAGRQGQVVFISGPAGVGKTALLQEALRRLTEEGRDQPPRVLWGACPPPLADSPPPPYAPWSQILTAAAPLLARSAEISPEALNRLLPLAPDLSLLRPGLLSPAQPNTAELRAALRQALHALALARPLILILEDAHWADDASLDLLRELTETYPAQPLLILVTHRLENLPLALLQVKRTLRQRRALLEIPLHAFDDEEARDLVKILLREATLPPALYAELIRYAQGLPLLLREAAETIRQARGRRTSLPTLRESIAFRLEGLNRAARDMLETAAVLGFSFSSQELAAALGWDPAAQAAALDTLAAHRFLTESSVPGDSEYAFPHQLIHEIILEAIPAPRAVFLRQQAALALQQVHPGENGFAARIAAHYQAANLPLPAARFWLEHARESADLAAFDAALQAIQRAEALLEGGSSLESRELRAQAALQRGVIAHYRGQAAEALPLLEEALRSCSDFPPLRAHALARLAYALYTCDRYAEAWQMAAESLLLARALSDSQAVTRALNIRGITALMMGRREEAIRDLREALTLEEALAQPSAQTVQSLNHLGTALVFAQEYAAAGETLAKTVELARRGGLRRLESAALTMQGQTALNCGRYLEAIQIYSQAIEVAGDSYLPGMWGKFAGRGAAYLRMGRLAEAQADFTRGLEIARQVESRYGKLLMRAYLALTALAAGRAPADSLTALEEEAAAMQLPAVALLAGLYRARLLRLAGEDERAAEAHQRAIQAAEASGVPQFIQNAQLEWLNAQSQTAPIDSAALEILSAQAQTAGEIPQQALAKLTLAALLRSENRLPEALTAAEEALSLARACPDVILTGEALLLLWQLHQTLNQPQPAQSCRAELLALAQTAFVPFQLAVDSRSAASMRDVILRHS
ncbi:MAG: hypothetical protein Fur0016_04940 [Anaerolineales bacterium]